MPVELRRRWHARGPPRLVIAATELPRWPELHPLITAVTDVQPDATADGETASIHERVPLGPFGVPARYRARRTCPSATRVMIEAWRAPGIRLVHTLDLTPGASGVEVDHLVSVEAPFWLEGFLASTAKNAHDAWVRAVQTWVAAQDVRERCGGTRAVASQEPFRRGLWSVTGERRGRAWEVLVGAEGAVLVRVPVGSARLELAPMGAFGRGGLSSDGYAPVPTGDPFVGWWVRGPDADLRALPEWAIRALLADPSGARTVVAGAIVVVTDDAAAALNELLGAATAG